MASESAVSPRIKFQTFSLNPTDYLSFQDIEQHNRVVAGTLAAWLYTRRYNFHRIVTKVGWNSRVRRDRWEQSLDSRTLGSDTQNEEV